MPQRRPMDALQSATSIGPDRQSQAIDDATLTENAMPLSPDLLRALGKPLSELLGAILTTPTKSGLPSKLRLTNWDAKTGEAAMHGLTKAGTEFRATPQQLDTLISSGGVDLQQPPAGAVDAIQRKLAALLGR